MEAAAQHPSTEPSGKPGDTHTYQDGAHQITRLRTADGWMIVEVR